jgi:biotin carboxyl carrier protein
METENNDQEKKIDFRTLWVDEVNYRTSLTRKFLNRKPYEPPSLKKVKAFIPGTVREIFVKRRTKVKAHDDLLVLEAMKMRNIIKAPIDGVIKAVHVKSGQVVPKEFLLIEIE